MELSERGMKLLMEYRDARKKWLALVASKGFNPDEVSSAREATEIALSNFGIHSIVVYELPEGEQG